MIKGGAGSDHLDGGVGVDTAVFDLLFKDCAVDLQKDGRIIVSGSQGVDQLINIERLQFADNQTFTLGTLGVLAAETELNKTNIHLMGLAQTGLEFLPFNG